MSYTLRFKHGKITILLLAAPLTPFTTIIDDLLTILRERYPLGLENNYSPEPIPIPESIIDVVLGVPKDQYDLTKGWEELDIGVTGITESPRSLALKEGAPIAFRFIGEEDTDKDDEKFWVEMPNLEDLYPEDE
jgi:hypothetical protein